MRKITREVRPEQFVQNILPWFLQHSKIFVDYIEIGQRARLPITLRKFTLESMEQYKESLNGTIWETKMMIPPIANIGKPIMDEPEFISSDYRILIHFFDCNYLSVWFKDDALAADFLAHSTGDGSLC